MCVTEPAAFSTHHFTEYTFAIDFSSNCFSYITLMYYPCVSYIYKNPFWVKEGGKMLLPGVENL